MNPLNFDKSAMGYSNENGNFGDPKLLQEGKMTYGHSTGSSSYRDNNYSDKIWTESRFFEGMMNAVFAEV